MKNTKLKTRPKAANKRACAKKKETQPPPEPPVLPDKAPPKVRRTEVERFIQASMLKIVNTGESEHACVSAANTLLGMMQRDRERLLRKRGQWNDHGEDERSQRYDPERAAELGKIMSFLNVYDTFKRSGLESALQMAENGETGTENTRG